MLSIKVECGILRTTAVKQAAKYIKDSGKINIIAWSAGVESLSVLCFKPSVFDLRIPPYLLD